MNRKYKKSVNQPTEHAKTHNQLYKIVGERDHVGINMVGHSCSFGTAPFSPASIFIAVAADMFVFPLYILLIAACDTPATTANFAWLPAISIALLIALIAVIITHVINIAITLIILQKERVDLRCQE